MIPEWPTIPVSTGRLFTRNGGKFSGTLTDFLKILRPDDRTRLKDILETACLKREPLAADFRIFRPDSAVRYLHAQGKVILENDGRAVRIAATLQDVTERKRADQAIQDLNRELQVRMTELTSANKELEEFPFSVSHDLRAPLRSIDGYSRMLLEDFGAQAKGDSRRYLDVIMTSARRLGQLIDELLAFSRMGWGPERLFQSLFRRSVRPMVTSCSSSSCKAEAKRESRRGSGFPRRLLLDREGGPWDGGGVQGQSQNRREARRNPTKEI